MLFKHIISHNRYWLKVYDMENDKVIIVNAEDDEESQITINYFHANFEYTWMRNIFPNLLDYKF